MSTPLFIKQRLLTPGPTAVPQAVLEEMAKPIIHHRTKAFQAIIKDLNVKLKWLFRTESPVLCIAGSGTTAFEAAQINLIKPKGKALTIAAGKFGERWQDIYETYGVDQIKLNVPWGDAVDPAEVQRILDEHRDISVVTVVHSETSTATRCDVQAIAAITRQTDAILIVDGITSIGAMPVEMDAWGIDVLVTGSQKAMMLPPGLGYLALGTRALERLKANGKPRFYNFDLNKWLKSHEADDFPFTPPVSLLRGQSVALDMIQSQGLENTWARAKQLAHMSRAAFVAMGLKLASTSPSDSVTSVFYPEGIVCGDFRKALREKHQIHIAGGQNGRGAKWKGKIFRTSQMGYVDLGDTLAGIEAIEMELIAAGQKITPGTGVAAAIQAMRDD